MPCCKRDSPALSDTYPLLTLALGQIKLAGRRYGYVLPKVWQSIHFLLSEQKIKRFWIWITSLQATHPTRAPGGRGWTSAEDAGRNPAHPKTASPPAHPAGSRQHQPALSTEKLCLLKLKENWSRLFLTVVPMQAPYGHKDSCFGNLAAYSAFFQAFHDKFPAIPAMHSAEAPSSFSYFTLTEATRHICLLQRRELLFACPRKDELR